MKTLELHYPMIQFLIITYIMSRVTHSEPGLPMVKRNKNQLHNYMTTGPARLAEIPTNRADIFPWNQQSEGK